MMLKNAFNSCFSEAKGERMEIPYIANDFLLTLRNFRIEIRPQHRGWRCVHHHQRTRYISRRVGHRLQPRHDFRNLCRTISKRGKGILGSNPFIEIIEAKLSIRDSRWRVAMVEDSNRDCR